jgi:hypothetical protein
MGSRVTLLLQALKVGLLRWDPFLEEIYCRRLLQYLLFLLHWMVTLQITYMIYYSD